MPYPIKDKLIQLFGNVLSAAELASIQAITEDTSTIIEEALRENLFEDFLFQMSNQVGIYSYPIIEKAYEELHKAIMLDQNASSQSAGHSESVNYSELEQIIQEELNKQANVINLVDKLKITREGTEVRIPAILSRGGAAEGLLKREHYMLTQKQVNLVRKVQLEAAFNSARSQQVRQKLENNENNVQVVPGAVSKLLGREISHRTHPTIFEPTDPCVVIGEQGEAIMLCEQAKLGSGNSGAVYIGQHLDTGEFCVIKDYFATNEGSKVEFRSEAKKLSELNLLIDTLNITTIGEERLISFQELAWGENLCDFLGVEHGKQKEHDLIKREEIFIKALEAIQELHEQKKLHRDIKVENMVWDDKSRTIKLVDMGLTVDMDREGKYIDSDTVVGTPAYIAPELVRNKMLGQDCVYSIQTEAYAAGMLACEIFSSNDLSIYPEQVVENIRSRSGNFLKAGLTGILFHADIFNPDTTGARPIMEQLFYDEIARLVEIDASYRATISEAITNLKAIHEQHKVDIQEEPFSKSWSHSASPDNPSTKSFERALSALLSTSITDLDKAANQALLDLNESKGFKGKLILSSSRTSVVDRSSLVNLLSALKPITSSSEPSPEDLAPVSDAIIDMHIAHLKQALEGKRFSSDERMADFIRSSTQQMNDILRSTHEYKAGNDILHEKAVKGSANVSKPEKDSL